MNIETLREFMVLAETGNFLEAAHRLHISQSTLSKHMQGLEAELGARVFNRTTRRVELSAPGQTLLPYAAEILRLQREYTLAISEVPEAEQNQ